MTYNPSLFTASNKSYGTIGPMPTDARYWFQNPDFSMRPFMSLNEVKQYFDTPYKRRGKFTVLVNEGGTLANGDIVGGTYKEYWWRDGTSDAQLVPKSQDGQSVSVINIKDERFGAKGDTDLSTFVGTDDTAAFESILNFVSKPVVKIVNGTIDPISGKLNVYDYSEKSTITYVCVPAGNYKLTRTILLNPNVRIVATSTGVNFISSGVAGDLFTTANLRGADGAVVYDTLLTETDLSTGVYGYVPGIEFERINFSVDTTKPETPNSFVKLSGSTDASIKNCTLKGSRLGLVLNSCQGAVVLNNNIEPTIGGIVLVECTAGTVKNNVVRGYKVPVFGLHNDVAVKYDFSSTSGAWFAGRCFGIYQSKCSVDITYNRLTDGLFHGTISEGSGGVLDKNIIKRLASGGAAYAQKTSPFLAYNVGETELATGVKLFSFQDYSLSQVRFSNIKNTFDTFGDVAVGSDISLLEFRSPSVALPAGVKVVGYWKYSASGDIKTQLSYNLSKDISLNADSSISGDVNVTGENLKIINGKTGPATLSAAGKIFAVTQNLLFKGFSLVVGVNGFINPVSGQYDIIFDGVDINLTSGSLLSNLQSIAGQINAVRVVFKNCNVHSDVPVDLISGLDASLARTDLTIQSEGNTVFTNVYVPANSTALRLIGMDGFRNFPSLADRSAANSYGGGKMLFKDPTFKDGLNSVVPYNTLGNGNVTISRVTADTLPIASPSDSGFIIRVSNVGAAAPDSGGFSFNLDSRPNAVFIARFIAVLPKGAIVSCNADQYGDGGFIAEGTAQIGTGKWEEYRFTIKCGASGTFGKVASFSVKGANSQSIYLGYATVYDMTADPVDLEFTLADKTKLDALENHFRGTYVSLTELQTQRPVGAEGDYAIVDTASADPVHYIWSTSGSNWVIGSPVVAGGGGTGTITSVNGQTGPAVNITKESLGVTNDFTTAEKTKLAGVSPGSTANSADQALRDRATHTGVQPINSVTGLQGALDSKQPTEAGKGLSSNDFSTIEKNKLASFPADGVASLLPKAGGALTGVLTWASSLLAAAGGALNLNNGDILGINAMFFADETDSDAEGIRFQKAAGTASPATTSLWDTLRAFRGELLWSGILGITSIGDIKAPNLVNTDIEVDISGTLGSGKVSEQNGSFAADTNHQLTDFLPVSPGQTVRVTFGTGTFNTISPFVGTGVVGYSSASYGAFVDVLLSSGTYNAVNGTALEDPMTFIDTTITIPAGINFIKVPNLIASGITMKVMTVRPVGTIKTSIAQLFKRVADLSAKATGGAGGSSSNDFTDLYKDKIDSIRTPVVSWDQNGIVFTDEDDNLKYRGVLKGGQLIWRALASSLRSFTAYPVGYAIDYDKMTNTVYASIMNEAGILTPENGFLQGHINPGLVTGATRFIPGGNTLRYDFVEADKICDLAVLKGVKIHANHLTWHTGVNAHVTAIVTDNPGNEKAMLTAYLKEYIPAAMGHFVTKYPGLVISWNCMNEAINASKPNGPPGGSAKASIWATWFTLDEMFEITFTAARLADPNCKLFFNDYDLETSNSTQSDAYIACINNLAAKNIMVGTPAKQVKVDGVGFQFHTVVGQDLGVARTHMKRFTDLGLYLALTELDANISSTTGYSAAMAETQAQFYYDLFVNYERAVPPAQRWGIMFWTVTDRFYIKNQGKNPPLSPTNAITEYPGIYDYYGEKKLAYERILSIPGRPASSADVFQDFIMTGVLPSITGTLTDGKTPLPWLEEGYTTADVGINSVGLRAAQNSQNSYQYELVDYPKPNRYVASKLSAIASPGSRTTYLLGRYKDANNYIAAASNNATTAAWCIIKRSSITGTSTDTTLFTSSVVPKVGDEVKLVCNGPTITLIVNGNVLGSAQETEFVSYTKCGYRLKGYNDKFTTWETFSADDDLTLA